MTDETDWAEIDVEIQQRDYDLIMAGLGYVAAQAAEFRAVDDIERVALLQYLFAHSDPKAFARSTKNANAELIGGPQAQNPIEAMGVGVDGDPEESEAREVLEERGYPIPEVPDEVREEVDWTDIDID